MSFTEYVAVEAVILAIVLVHLAFFMGRNSLKKLEMEKQQRAYEQLFAMARPIGRLPSRREKKIMKQEKTRVHSAKEELKALDHKGAVLCVAFVVVFAKFCLATHAAMARYAGTIVLLIELIVWVIFLTAAHYWSKKWSIAVVFLLIFSLILTTIGNWNIANMV